MLNVGASGGAESPLISRNHLGEPPLSRPVAAIRPSRPIAMVLTGYATLVFALKIASGVPVAEKRITPDPDDEVPITMRPLESTAIEFTALLLGSRAADPVPPFAG